MTAWRDVGGQLAKAAMKSANAAGVINMAACGVSGDSRHENIRRYERRRVGWRQAKLERVGVLALDGVGIVVDGALFHMPDCGIAVCPSAVAGWGSSPRPY